MQQPERLALREERNTQIRLRRIRLRLDVSAEQLGLRIPDLMGPGLAQSPAILDRERLPGGRFVTPGGDRLQVLSRRMNEIELAVRALEQSRTETFKGRVDFGRRHTGPEIPAQIAKRDALNVELFQFSGLIGVHARQVRDRGLLGLFLLAFFGLLDRAIERGSKLGEGGRVNAIGRRALARFGGGFLAVRSGDENERRIGAKALRLRRCNEPAEVRHGGAVKNGVRSGEFYLPREILGRLDTP